MRAYGFGQHQTAFAADGSVQVAKDADHHNLTPIFGKLAREFNAQLGLISIAEKPTWLVTSTTLVPAEPR